MNIKEIILKYLKDNNYYGLYSEDLPGSGSIKECSCSTNDLMPCDGEYGLKCIPGYVENYEGDKLSFRIKKKKELKDVKQSNNNCISCEYSCKNSPVCKCGSGRFG